MKRPRIRESFVRECDRFERCADGPPRTQPGLEQFAGWESQGIRPTDPDPYFVRLCDGKAWWEWQLNEMAVTYGTPDWWGWAMLTADGWDDAGLSQLRQRIGL